MDAIEANFDGLAGPTHNYAGLAFGNVASEANRARVSNPRRAALQGLAKMKQLADMGFAQAVLPPQPRPSIAFLRALGFSGTDRAVLRRAAREAPRELAAACSASAMWTANAATVSAGADCNDGRVHFTPANLVSQLHRALEAETTRRILQAVFSDPEHFVVHAPLPATPALGDEGAANHARLCARHGMPGVELFVYGRDDDAPANPHPSRYPARQTRAASAAIARRHGLAPDAVVFAQQHPQAIDQGVFHNDVVAVANRDLLFCHERAFVEPARVYEALRASLAPRGAALTVIEVSEAQVPLADAVSSYLFNSQLLDADGQTHLLVVPEECLENPRVAAFLETLGDAGGRLAGIMPFDLRESMRNGGGPACLRLRVVLTAAERMAVAPGVWLDERLYRLLVGWVERHYRDRLAPEDLADPDLLDETRRALDELGGILGIGGLCDG